MLWDSCVFSNLTLASYVFLYYSIVVIDLNSTSLYYTILVAYRSRAYLSYKKVPILSIYSFNSPTL